MSGSVSALLASLALLLGAVTGSLSARDEFAKPAEAEQAFLDFNAVPTAAASGYMLAAEPYLLQSNNSIRVIARTPANARLVFVNNLGLYGGRAVVPTVSQNFLTLTDTGNAPASFTMEFETGVERVTFRIPRLFAATSSGVTFPAWTAAALSASGEVLSTHSEGLRRRFADIAEEEVSLSAPGFAVIKCVRIDSNPQLNGVPFAGFSTALLERMSFTLRDETRTSHPVQHGLHDQPAVTGCGLPRS